MSHIFDTLQYAEKLVQLIDNSEIYKYITNDFDIAEKERKVFIEQMKYIMDYMNNHFELQNCKNIMSMTNFTQNIIKAGINNELDILQKKYSTSLNDLYFLQRYMNNCADTNDWIKVHETEKSGLSLQITKTRSEKMKIWIKKQTHDEYVNNTKEQKNCNVKLPLSSFNLENINFVKAGSSNVEISEPTLNQICKDINIYRLQLNDMIAKGVYTKNYFIFSIIALIK